MRTYFMESMRLGFSVWRREDLALAERLWGNPEVTRYITASGRMSPDEIKARLSREIENESMCKIQYFPVFLKETGEFAGCCGLRPYGAESGMDELGVHLLPDFHGAGIGTEACRRVVRYAFETLSCRGLFAGHNPKNTVSAGMLKKVGFRFEREEYYAPTGLMHPSYLMNREQAENGKIFQMKTTSQDDPDFIGLVDRLGKELSGRYGPGFEEEFFRSCPHDLLTVLVIYADGVPAACGGFRRLENGCAEIKRIFVSSDCRRGGLARKILQELEKLAKESGFGCALLETGDGQPEAIRLYHGAGYRDRESYASDGGGKHSISMEKTL